MTGGTRWLSRAALTISLALATSAVAAGAQTSVLIVSGIGGDPRFTRAFGSLAATLAQAAHERAGLPDTAITWLGDTAAPRSRWHRGVSTRENVERALTRLSQGGARGQVVIVLVGHGSGEGPETRISLPGPDMTAADFARALSRIQRRLAFVNLTSASGDMLALLAAPNRVVITATRSAFQRNESHFGRFFVNAFAREGADTDKDGRVSLLEAFRYAESETKRYYETDGKLATENAQMADQDQLAVGFFLDAGPASQAAGGQLAALYEERDTLDERIAALKRRKAQMTADAYDEALEQLLLALARKSREIRQLERGS